MDKMQIMRVLIDLAEKESDRFWTRYQTILYANTGLIAILSLIWSISFSLLLIIPSALGVITSIAWLKINAVSHFYEHRWHRDMEELIKSDDMLSEWVRGRNRPRIPRPHKSGLCLFNLVPFAFLSFWVVILVGWSY